MRVHEIRDLHADDFAAQIADARKQIVELRFQLAARKLENPAKLRAARKHLARLLTIQTEKANPNHKPTPSKKEKAATK
jgi:large subunit ribosomal protein L29